MGFWSSIFRRDEESEEIGRNWAERVIDSCECGDGLVVSNGTPEVTPELVSYLGDEYSNNGAAFYKGFSETWNAHVDAAVTEETSTPWWHIW